MSEPELSDEEKVRRYDVLATEAAWHDPNCGCRLCEAMAAAQI